MKQISAKSQAPVIPQLDQWLRKHGFSRDRLPGPFHREVLFNKIRIGSRVTIETPHGSLLTGRATIHNQTQDCWVLNLGGRHGTPGVACRDNVVCVAGSPLT